MKKIYVLRIKMSWFRLSGLDQYDRFFGFVVVADSIDQARYLCYVASNELYWLVKTRSTCLYVGRSGLKRSRILLSDFLAG